MAYTAASRSWFAVFNNPADHGYPGEPNEVCNRLMTEWCITDSRVGAWAYCVKHYMGCFPVYDEENDPEHKSPISFRPAVTEEEKAQVPPDLHHIHMVLEDDKPMGFSVVRKTYAIGSHFEPTRGTRKDAEDYISKTGKYDESKNRELGLPWEEVLFVARRGEISGRQGQQNQLEQIKSLVDSGMTPMQILRKDVRLYRFESEIKKIYFDKRVQETPMMREVRVYWHTGGSGSGKSFYRNHVNEVYGEENVFYLTTYNKDRMWDGYVGQQALWMEDFKGGIPFGDLLRYLDVYKATLPARYTNGVAVWKQVDITSVYTPQGVYRKMVSSSEEGTDTVKQLLRRITQVVYHYVEIDKDGNKQYLFEFFPPGMTMEQMASTVKNKKAAQLHESASFTELGAEDELPF